MEKFLDSIVIVARGASRNVRMFPLTVLFTFTMVIIINCILGLMICLGFLFQLSTIFSGSSFESFSGDSTDKWERPTSPRQFLIIFILKNFVQGMLFLQESRDTLVKFGNIAMGLLLVVSSFSSFLVFSLGCVVMYLQ